MRKLSLLLAAALAAACGGNSADEFANGTPDVSGMQLEVTGSSAEGVVRDPNSDSVAQDVTLSNPPEYLAKTRAAIKELNDFVKTALTPVATLVQQTAQGGSNVGDVKVYGPKDQGNVTWKLSVKKKADKKFGFRLEGKPLGADDSAYKTIVVGEMDKSDDGDAHRGKGIAGFDLSAYAAIDSTSHATGKLLVAYAHAASGGKTLVYRLAAFSGDTTVHAPVSAVIYGHKTASGEAVVRTASYTDVIPTTSAPELMFSHLHWIPGTGGRADLLIPNKLPNGSANGDVPAGKFYVAKSCWNASEQEGFKALGTCTVGQGLAGCTFDVAGSATACTASGRDPSESDTGSDTTPEAGAPATPPQDPPTDLPAF